MNATGHIITLSYRLCLQMYVLLVRVQSECEIWNCKVLCYNYVILSLLFRAVVCNVILHDWDSASESEFVKPQLDVIVSLCLQNVDILRPVEPQGHDLPQDPDIPTFPTLIDDPGNDPQPVPSDPTLPPAVQPAPFDPTPIHPVPFDPSVVVNPSQPLSSSSSESDECLVNQQQQPRVTGPFDSSSEEIGGPVALRPPLNFRYQRRERKKRQALLQTSPTHNPFFLSDFPSGASPFRSCPGPSRYTTV